MNFKEDKEFAAMAGKKSSRAGVPNKANTDVRKAFQLLVQNNLERLQEDLDALKPIDRLRIILELAKFIVPQLQSVSLSDLREAETFGFSAITIRLKSNDGGGNGKAKVINETNNEREGDDGTDSDI